MTIVFKYSQPKHDVGNSRSYVPGPNADPVSMPSKPTSHIYDVRFPNWTKQYSSNINNENVLENLIEQVKGSRRDTCFIPFDSNHGAPDTLTKIEKGITEQIPQKIYQTRNGFNSIEITVPFTVLV